MLRVAGLAEEHAIALVSSVPYGLLDAAVTRLSAPASRQGRARLALLLQDAPASVRAVLDEAPAPTRVFVLCVHHTGVAS